MKSKITSILLLTAVAVQLTACSLEPTCKEPGCEETNIYEDGYCKVHYYENVGENVIKDIFNN